MKNLFVFDLDNTLGKKTPSWPAITKTNADFLRQISSYNQNLLIFATGRPRSQAFLGFRNGGISKEEVYKIFPGGIYEDGLFVELRNRTLFDAVDEASDLFRKIKTGFFDDEAKQIFRANGFLLFPSFILRGKENPYAVLDYSEEFAGGELIVPKLTPLYQQGNDVRETYKLPQRYLNDELKAQIPIFEKVERIAKEYLHLRYHGWEETSKLERWEDAVEIYPKLEGKHFLKGEGIGRLLPTIDKDVKVYVCCDGRNDISLVSYVTERFPNYHVVCPSNVSSELKKILEEGSYNHSVLEQNCSEFAEGLEKLIA